MLAHGLSPFGRAGLREVGLARRPVIALRRGGAVEWRQLVHHILRAIFARVRCEVVRGGYYGGDEVEMATLC